MTKKTHAEVRQCLVNYVDSPIGAAVAAIGGKWKIPILYILREGTLRFSELQRALPKVTQKMLTQQLRELEADSIISRKVYAQVPPKVEYSALPLAQKLEPIIDLLCEWGSEFQDVQKSSKKAA